MLMFSDADIASAAPQKAALMRAIRAVGGVGALRKRLAARRKPASRAAVYQWLDAGRCPKDRVALVAYVSGVPKHELRPDLHRAPTVTAVAAEA